jgi:hypothetical protein
MHRLGIIRYYSAFNKESLFVTRPDTIKEFMQTNGYKFRKLEAGRNIIEQVTGHGLLVVDGEEHKACIAILVEAMSLMRNSIKEKA